MTTNAPSIEVRDLTKRYGNTVAVDHLSFEVHPGRVTGFLGPNGAGKSTTLRMIVGLDAPTSGSALINGRPFVSHHQPLFEVGALLDPKAFHRRRRSCRRHVIRHRRDPTGMGTARGLSRPRRAASTTFLLEVAGRKW